MIYRVILFVEKKKKKGEASQIVDLLRNRITTIIIIATNKIEESSRKYLYPIWILFSRDLPEFFIRQELANFIMRIDWTRNAIKKRINPPSLLMRICIMLSIPRMKIYFPKRKLSPKTGPSDGKADGNSYTFPCNWILSLFHRNSRCCKTFLVEYISKCFSSVICSTPFSSLDRCNF